MRLSRMTPADLPAVLDLALELGDVRHLNIDELTYRTFGDPASPEEPGQPRGSASSGLGRR